jgi:hypothetical protein
MGRMDVDYQVRGSASLRHLHESSPSPDDVGGRFSDFEPFRTVRAPQVLHDAFFKWQTKPPLSGPGADSVLLMNLNLTWSRHWRRRAAVPPRRRRGDGVPARATLPPRRRRVASTPSAWPSERVRVSRESRGGFATASVPHRQGLLRGQGI